ncbi:MAG: sugar kinase [Gammaproteobacteria bacterium]|nr:sugar kinase [Gammaproteobacteria bacterium]
MERLTENKIVLIVRRTRLQELIARFNTEDQARFYVEHLGADFSDYQAEDRTYRQAVREAESILSRHARLQTVDRAFLPNFIFGPKDAVIALGQDGLVANILKYLDGQLLIGVNPDTERWEGVLLRFTVPDLDQLIPEVFAGQRHVHAVTMAQAKLNNGESLCGVNDLFIGPRTHTSASYTIRIGSRTEKHSSSGIIVSTGLGSTGWFRSILAGAAGIASSLSGQPPEISEEKAFEWDSDYLYFSVREPWPSKTSAADITFGKLTPDKPLILASHMPENGVIFSDGIESDFLQFNSGTEATISLADKKGQLVT